MTIRALILNDTIVKYPYDYSDLVADNPNTSFPDNLTNFVWEDFNIFEVFPSNMPTHNNLTQKCIEGVPELVNGTWTQTWIVEDKTQEEIDVSILELQNYITARVQKRLDDFAKSRNYDGVLSACTYYTSSVEKFRIEAQYMMEARDATWSTLYWVLNEATIGNISVPTSYTDVEVYLPSLNWPIISTSSITIGIS